MHHVGVARGGLVAKANRVGGVGCVAIFIPHERLSRWLLSSDFEVH